MMRIQLIFNPAAGQRSAQRPLDEIQQNLLGLGVEVELVQTTARGNAESLAAEMARVDGIGVIGGDGTVSEVVNGLMQGTSADQPAGPLAIYPAGTGNDLAATLSFQADPVAFAQRIVQNQRLLIDVPSVAIERAGAANRSQERYFINNLGIGFEGAVALRAQKIGWISGQLCYMVAALQTIFAYRATEMACHWIKPDDRDPVDPTQSMTFAGDALMVTVGNNHRAGGGFRLTPDAKLNDGLIDVGILKAVSKVALVRLLALALKGKHTADPNVSMLRTSRLDVICGSPCLVHADGELLDAQARIISIRSGEKKLLVYTAVGHK